MAAPSFSIRDLIAFVLWLRMGVHKTSKPLPWSRSKAAPSKRSSTPLPVEAPIVSVAPVTAPAALSADSAPASTSARPTLAYVLGGIGIAALAGSGYFAWTGRSQRQGLAETCSPTCTDPQVAPVRSKYLVADILLALGVTSLGAGTYFYFSAPERVPASTQSRGLLMGVRSAF